MGFCSPASVRTLSPSDSEDEDQLADAVHDEALSYVGKAVTESLRRWHWIQHERCWNINWGTVVGECAQTPSRQYWGQRDILPANEHSDWFPQKMYEIITRAEHWVDVCSLTQPDGKFFDAFKAAIEKLAENAEGKAAPITVRLLFGNIVGMPTNPDGLIRRLTEDVSEDANLNLWIGSWRKGLSWNHSKIIAVDGLYLFTGGHNLWDAHYLKKDPIHDLSMEVYGPVAEDGHCFANEMWSFIKQEQNGIVGAMAAHLPDWMELANWSRVAVSEWPEGEVDIFPPLYTRGQYGYHPKLKDMVPMIPIGRLGALHRFQLTANPADTAIVAMLESAQDIIQMSLQDLGPLTMPFPNSSGLCYSIPGGVWPKAYLKAMATAIADRGVDVEIILSNPHAIPGGENPNFTNYGNGWTCEDCASEIIKMIKQERPDEHSDDELRTVVKENLRIVYMKQQRASGNDWPDGQRIGNHAKFFIVDKQAYYLGSQNMYIANLAEWGVIVDDAAMTEKLMNEYWNPCWRESYTEADCDVDKVMDGLDISRDGESLVTASQEEKEAGLNMTRQSYKWSAHSDADEHWTHPDEVSQHGLN
eukprot:TRINITY_DN30385_c0_g2_i1.p1 TRINITY_DN30385_c0_g2~~TRINITY_DN30385_c0_g2_i1.p1  ORF type:complete len:587 (-),score=102.44 TRINITY_DN30385_c0_g2_i1:193-1953(-)